jgi:CRP-like cAMP-binding protein
MTEHNAAEEAIRALREHWLFEGVPDADLQPVLESAHVLRFDGGDVILREGEPPDGLYLIVAGSVQVRVQSEMDGTLLTLVRSGEVLGELGVIDGEPRSGTAVAMTTGIAFFLEAKPFSDLLDRSCIVAKRLLLLLAGRLRRANRRLLEMPPPGPVRRRTTPISL